MTDLSQRIQHLIAESEKQVARLDSATILSLLDHTRLKKDDTTRDVLQWCEPASGAASVCVYPEYISAIKQHYQALTICSVVNFPDGEASLSDITSSINIAIESGATEIDMVLPYNDYLGTQRERALEIVVKARQACTDNVLLKIILETEMFASSDDIYKASIDCLERGANFIKTSTGTRPIGATLVSAAAILLAIKDTDKKAGIKISGGIQSLEQCHAYSRLAQILFGEEWTRAEVFRIGSSRLLNLLKDGQ